jgi:hypothetical protein
VHLHFEMWEDIEGVGFVAVPPYLSLVQAYEDLMQIEVQPCAVLPSEGGVLDDAGSCLNLFGPPATWRVVPDDGYGGQLHWTNGWVSATPGNWARWDFNLAEAGTYDVAIFTTPDYAKSQAVPMTLAHAGEDSELVVDMSEGDGWLSLGEFDFAAGGDQSLSIFDNTGEDSALQRHIDIDAVRLSRIDVPGDDGGPLPGDVDGGDGAGGGDPSVGPNEPDDDPLPGDTDDPGHGDDHDGGGKVTHGGSQPDGCASVPAMTLAAVLTGLRLLRKKRASRS